ncbi:MAG: putative toxin-antitoxin system toxin component, PIN family [Mycoplasmataceae bacterium]|nr:putative toxin-antitoxin system toxin component, PIN family [Mycoplasmataceae bacterium]
MRYMLDTDILISLYFLNSEIVRNKLTQLIRSHNDIYIDNYCVNEFARVIFEKHLLKLDNDKNKWIINIKQIEQLIFDNFYTITCTLPGRLSFSIRDPKDEMVLKAALDNKIDYLITGDKDLLDVKQVKSLKIISLQELTMKFH